MLDALFEIISSILKTVLDLLQLVFNAAFEIEANRHRPHTAKFAPPSRVVSRWNNGFCLDGVRSLSEHHSYMNAMVVGPSGTGKTTSTILPTIIRLAKAGRCSMCIHDPSGEIYKAVAGYLTQQGYEIRRINYADASVSDGYNPLERLKPGDRSGALQVASTLVYSGLGPSTGDSGFWNSQAEALLSVLISGLCLPAAAGHRNLANVLRLLNLLSGKPDTVDRFFARHADQALFEEFCSIIAMPDKLLGNVLATAKSALKIILDKQVALVTAHNSVDLSQLRKRKTAVFVQNSVLSQNYLKPITSLFFGEIFEVLLGKLPEKDDLNVNVILDEASSIKIDLPLVLSNCRKYRTSVLLALQSVNSLAESYSKYDSEVIQANCWSKLYFTNIPLSTGRELEQIMGRYEYMDKSGNQKVRDLMSADELRMLDSRRALLLAGNNAPVLLRLRPWYKTRLRRLINLPAPASPSKLPFTEIPMLPLDHDHTDSHAQPG